MFEASWTMDEEEEEEAEEEDRTEPDPDPPTEERGAGGRRITRSMSRLKTLLSWAETSAGLRPRTNFPFTLIISSPT